MRTAASATPSPTTTSLSEQARAVLARQLARGRAPRRHSVRLHVPRHAALPPPVALGLVLSRHRLVPPRRPSRPRGAAHGAARRPGRRLRPAHGVLAQPPALAARPALRDAARARQPPHDDDRAAAAALRMGARGRREQRRAGLRDRVRCTRWRRTWTGSSASATSTATASSASSCPTSRGSTTARSTTPSTARTRTTSPATSAWWRATAAWAGAPTRSRPSTTSTSRTCGSTSPTRSVCAPWRASPQTTRTRGVRTSSRRRCSSAALDPATGLFYDLAGRAERPVHVSTWSSLSPLMLDTLPEDVRRRLVEEHLLDPRRYRAPFGIPSVAMDEPSFRPGFDLWRTWRGPSWMNVAWLLTPALRELGYDADADRIAAGMSRGRRPRRPARVLRPAHRRRAGGEGLLLVGARRRPRVGVTAGDLVDVARDDAALDAALAGDGQGGRDRRRRRGGSRSWRVLRSVLDGYLTISGRRLDPVTAQVVEVERPQQIGRLALARLGHVVEVRAQVVDVGGGFARLARRGLGRG